MSRKTPLCPRKQPRFYGRSALLDCPGRSHSARVHPALRRPGHAQEGDAAGGGPSGSRLRSTAHDTPSFPSLKRTPCVWVCCGCSCVVVACCWCCARCSGVVVVCFHFLFRSSFFVCLCLFFPLWLVRVRVLPCSASIRRATFARHSPQQKKPLWTGRFCVPRPPGCWSSSAACLRLPPPLLATAPAAWTCRLALVGGCWSGLLNAPASMAPASPLPPDPHLPLCGVFFLVYTLFTDV